MLRSSSLCVLLAASVGALNVGAPCLRSSSRSPVRSPVPVLLEEVEEAMTEEEYEMELAREAQERAEAQAEGAKEEGDLLSVEEQERIKAKVASFAPWMTVDPEAIAKAKKAREERRAKATAVDAMRIDPQAAELNAASGLNSKVLSEDEIELRWDTTDETGNAGFIVQRRQGGSADFESIASFENFAPLKTKGANGGTYVYLDAESGLEPGTWVYRILDCDTSGVKSAMCQKLVEIESKDEQQATFIVGTFIAGLALVLIAAGIFIDPIQTTQTGRGFGGF